MTSHEIAWFGPFVFDPTHGDLSKGAVVVRLSPRVAAVLDLLIERGGTVVTPAELRDAIWPDTNVDDPDAVSLCVGELRTAIGDDESRPEYIETIPNRGYRFIAPVSRGRHSGTAEVPRVATPATSGRWFAIVAAATLILLALFALMRGWSSTRQFGTTTQPVALAVLLFDDADTAASAYRSTFGSELAAAMAQPRGSRVSVLGPAATARFDGNRTPIDTIARVIGATHVMSGTIRRTAKGVHVYAQLIRVRDRKHVWDARAVDSVQTTASQSAIADAFGRGAVEAVTLPL